MTQSISLKHDDSIQQLKVKSVLRFIANHTIVTIPKSITA